MPEDGADGFLLDVEEVHLLTDAAVVAALGFLQLVQIGFQFLRVAPGGAVDAAEHGVAVVAAPIGPGGFHQLEGGADVARAAQMRAAAEVQPLALAVDGDGLVRGQVADELGLEALALGLEQSDGILAGQNFAGKGRIGGDDLAHLGLDGGEVVGGEGLVAGEVVIEPVLDGRADGDLRARVERLHSLRQHMRRVVADEFQRGFVLAGDEFDGGIIRDFARHILFRAVDDHGQRRAGEAGTDGGGDFRARHRALEFSFRTVGEGDYGHVLVLVMAAPYGRAASTCATARSLKAGALKVMGQEPSG